MGHLTQQLALHPAACTLVACVHHPMLQINHEIFCTCREHLFKVLFCLDLHFTSLIPALKSMEKFCYIWFLRVIDDSCYVRNLTLAYLLKTYVALYLAILFALAITVIKLFLMMALNAFNCNECYDMLEH